MLYTKEMIDLIMTIRRQVPLEEKSSVRLRNPELMTDLRRICRSYPADPVTGLIEELIRLTGEAVPTTDVPAQKTYRGRSPSDTATAAKASGSGRTYRGRAVNS